MLVQVGRKRRKRRGEGKMKPVENHMVALPQPELDKEAKCNHEFYNVISIQDWDESSIWFEIQCQDCGKIGYANGSITLEEMEWDDE